MKALIWVQHLLGTGHLRRALVLGGALADAGWAVTVASGGPPHGWRVRGDVRFVQLPALQAADASFSALLDPAGEPVDAAHWAARRGRLSALVAEHAFDLLVTELFPFGRGAFRAEVLALIEACRARQAGCRVVASVRDVLVTKPDPAKLARMRDTALRLYDRVLVHGDETVLPFELSFPLAGELDDRLCHTGYLTDASATSANPDRSEVLVSAGGGRVGGRLLGAALGARPLSRLGGLPWRLVTGAGLGEAEAAALRAQAGPGVAIDRHHPELLPFLERAVVAVGQAGYNSVVEALVARAPLVLVPFATAVEDEQTIRARRLAELGLATLVEPAALHPVTLAAAIDEAAGRAPPTVLPRMDGAARSIAHIQALFAHGGDG